MHISLSRPTASTTCRNTADLPEPFRPMTTAPSARNAREYSEGARELSISTEINASNDALVAVRDSGPGLDPTSLEHLFDAFYTTKSSGMGMGLSICRSIIEAHKGRIRAEANVPQGATFQFTLPWQGAS
jgi:signal transduction histidine kinase